MGTRGLVVLLAAGLLAGCGSSISDSDRARCTEIYRLGSIGGDHLDEIAREAQRIEDDQARAAAQRYVEDPNSKTVRALVKACGD